MISRFEQGNVWIDQRGAEHNIKRMDPNHRKNVIAFLRRNADTVAFGESMRMTLSLLGMGDSDGVAMVEMKIETRADEIVAHPHRWLENTPLMQALVKADRKYEKRLRKVLGR